MRCTLRKFVAAAAAASLLTFAWISPAGAQEEPAQAAQEGVETLTRGPVHEAFAAPSANDPAPSMVVKDQPPDPIDEEAPDYKPEGAIWIPGYWDWDHSSNNFLWVSGLWRVPPPGMRWVPPYWTEATDGWQRIPGFWLSAETTEVSYQESPPESQEVGPSTPAPGDNYFYIPGSWVYDSGFRWRTGYWSPYRDNYVWCPDRWYWTPSGYVFTAGFWDWQPGVRGQLFAPIHFTSAVYRQPGWRYRPWCVIDSSRFYANLWIGPGAQGYYFGDYYGPSASRWGFFPWVDWSYGNRRFYDPLWSWSNVYYGRRGIDFLGRTQGWHRYYAQNERFRPARTFEEQRRLVAEGRLDRESGLNILAADLRDVVRRQDSALRLSQVTDQQRESVRQLTNEIRELNTERRRLEAEARVAGGTDRPARDPSDRGRQARQIKLPKVSEEVQTAAAGKRLPTRPEPAPEADATDRTARTRDDRTKAREPADRTAARERGPSRETPRTETRRPETPATPSPETPSAETPRTPGKPTVPPMPPGTSDAETPKPETPKAEKPKPEKPKAEKPRPDAPGRESPRPDRPGAGREDTPRSDRGRSESPRVETPGAETPTDTPRVERPRTEAPSGKSRPRTEAAPDSTPPAEPRVRPAPRTAEPRTAEPRTTPRTAAPVIEPGTETPRTAEPRASAPRASSPRAATRSESPRVSSKPKSRTESSRSSSNKNRSQDPDRR